MMSRSRLLSRCLWAVTILSLVISTQLGAFEYKVADDIYLSGDFSEDVMLAGGTVNFDGTIWGDLLVGAQTIVFDGIVDGNVNVGGYRVTVNGEICRSLRAAGNIVNINSRIDGDATVFAQDISVASDASVGRDAAFFATQVFIDGDVGSDVYIAAAKVTISGRIEGNLKIKAGSISIAPTAYIGGDFEYESRQKAKIAPEAQVNGETRWKKRAKDVESNVFVDWVPPPSSLLWSLYLLIGSLFIGALLIFARRESVLNVASEIRANGALAGVVGLGIIFLGPFVLILGFLLGVLPGLVGVATYGLLLVVSKIFVAITIGILILGRLRRDSRISLGWSLVIGLLLLAIGFKIPFIGWFIYILVWAVGAGAITILFFRRRKPAATEAGANAIGQA